MKETRLNGLLVTLLSAFLFNTFSWAGVKVGDVELVSLGDGGIKYKGRHFIAIGWVIVNRGWRQFFLHASPHLHKNPKGGREGNTIWYERTAIDDSYTTKVVGRVEKGNVVFLDFYLIRNQAKAHGGYSLVPFRLNKEFMKGAKVVARKRGKIIRQGRIGEIEMMHPNFILIGADEIVIENFGYKLKISGAWLGLRKDLYWIGHFWGNLKPGEKRHWSYKIEFSGELEGPISFKPVAEQNPPKYVPDVYITPEDEFILIPKPKEVSFGKGRFLLNSQTRIVIGNKITEQDTWGAYLLRKELKEVYRLSLKIERANRVEKIEGNILIGEPWKNEMVGKALAEYGLIVTRKNPGQEGYLLKITPKGVVIAGSDERGTYWGIQTLLQLLRKREKDVYLPEVTIKDWPTLVIRGAGFFSNAPVPVDSFKIFAERVLARHKLNTIFLSLDQWFNFPSHPEINPKGVKKEQLEEILKICKENFIQVIPEIECLRSCHNILKVHPELKESKGTYVNACPSNPALYKLLFELFKDVEDIFKPYGGFSYFSIGCDEVEQAPFGVCERCKKTGKKPYELFADAITRFYDYWKKKGVKILCFHDSLVYYGSGSLVPARKLIPKDTILMFWGYMGGAPFDECIKDKFPLIGCWQFHSGNVYSFASIMKGYEKGLGIYGLHSNLSGNMTTNFAFQYPNVAHHNYLEIYAGDCAWNPGQRPPNKIPYNMYQEYLNLLSKKPNLAKEKEVKSGFLVDLEPFMTKELPASLKDLPRGKVRLKGTVFDIKDRGIALWGPLVGRRLPDRVSIPINRKAKSLIFLHGCLKDVWSDIKGYRAWKGNVGRYEIHLAGGAIVRINLTTCESIQAFTARPEREVREPAFVAWRGEKGKVYAYKWVNPAPNRIVEKVEFISSKTTAGPMLLAITGIDGEESPQSAPEKKPEETVMVDASLVLYLDFDAGLGNMVKDKSGNGYDANSIGNPKWIKGVKGYAMEFDGTNDVIYVEGEKISISNTKSFTVSFWVKPEAKQKRRYRIFKGGGRDWQPQTVSMRMEVLALGRENRFTRFHLSPGRWQMVTFTYNANSQLLKFYLNGKLVGMQECRAKFGPAKGFVIGAGEHGSHYPDGYFKGAVDEFKIYSRVLSPKEIKADYEKTKTIFSKRKELDK